jgi:hypothetical protein
MVVSILKRNDSDQRVTSYKTHLAKAVICNNISIMKTLMVPLELAQMKCQIQWLAQLQVVKFTSFNIIVTMKSKSNKIYHPFGSTFKKTSMII